MEDALVPLVSVLLGAVLGAGTSLLVERSRSKNARKQDLLAVRRTVQLDALELVHVTIATFRAIFAHNHDGTDPDADAAQAEAFERHTEQLDALELKAQRVDVLASEEVGEKIAAIRDRILQYLHESSEKQAFLVVEFTPAIEDLERLQAEMKTLVRKDLRTAELDVKN